MHIHLNKLHLGLVIALVTFVLIYFFIPQVREVSLSQFFSQEGSQRTSLDDTLRPLGLYISFIETEKEKFTCDPQRLPSAVGPDILWQNICEGSNNSSYIGFFWKRLDVQKMAFQNGLVNYFMSIKAEKEGKEDQGKLNCEENKTYALGSDAESMQSVVIECVVVPSDPADTMYINFVYSYPPESNVFDANTVIVISDTIKKTAQSMTGKVLYNLKTKKGEVVTTNLEFGKFFDVERVYAQDGAGDGSGGDAGSGDGSGTGDGSCSSGGDTGCSSGDSGTSPGGEGGGGWYPPEDPAPAPTSVAEPVPVTPTCTFSYYYEVAGDSGNCEEYIYGYNVYSCSDGTNPEYISSVTEFDACYVEPTEPDTPTTPPPTVTCDSYDYDNSSTNGSCTNTWTNTYHYCTDGRTWTDEGEVTTTCDVLTTPTPTLTPTPTPTPTPLPTPASEPEPEYEYEPEPESTPSVQFSVCTTSTGACTYAPGTHKVITGTPLTLRWVASADSCAAVQGPGFSISSKAPVGSDAITADAVPGTPDTYRVACQYGSGIPVQSTIYVATQGQPVLTVSKPTVAMGGRVTLSWDTNNGDETQCSLMGKGVSDATLDAGGGGDKETGSVDVVINGHTTFTLTCDSLTAIKTVDIIPQSWES